MTNGVLGKIHVLSNSLASFSRDIFSSSSRPDHFRSFSVLGAAGVGFTGTVATVMGSMCIFEVEVAGGSTLRVTFSKNSSKSMGWSFTPAAFPAYLSSFSSFSSCFSRLSPLLDLRELVLSFLTPKEPLVTAMELS